MGTGRGLAALILLGVAPTLARAEVFHLRDGRELIGAYLGEDRGQVLVLTAAGAQREVPREEVLSIDWSHTVDPRLRQRAERARAKLVQRQQREARRLLDDYGRAPGPLERAALEDELARYPAEVQLEPLVEALRDRHPATARLAVTRLAALKLPKVVGPLVQAAVTSEQEAVRTEAHAAALAVDPALARRFYEAVAAAAGAPARRLRALEQVRALGERASVPGLVQVLEHVRAELRATQARAGSLRRVPLNLGTQSGAAVSAPLELPEASLAEVRGGALVGAAGLLAVQRAAAAALRSITGVDLGDDPARWQTWWERQDHQVHPLD